MSDLLTIGEFARRSALSVSAVRFYADRGVLIPTATDASSGYRYFAESQVAVARLIRDLRRIEMPLTLVGDVLAMSPADRNVAVTDHVARLEARLREVRTLAHEMAEPSRFEPHGKLMTRVRSADLAEGLRQVLPMAGGDDTLPHLMCVLVEVKEGSVRCVATDGHRLAIRDLMPSSPGDSFSVVVAAAAIEPWPTGLDPEGVVDLGVDGGDLVARGAGDELRCPTIPVTFPDYETVLRRSARADSVFVLDREGFLAMMSSFSGEEAVTLTTKRAGLAASRDGAEQWIDANVDGPSARVAVNPKFAVDAAEHAVGNDLVIEVDDDIHPVVFRSADDGTYTSLLMPVKTD